VLGTPRRDDADPSHRAAAGECPTDYLTATERERVKLMEAGYPHHCQFVT
jgi:hypothetical protein